LPNAPSQFPSLVTSIRSGSGLIIRGQTSSLSLICPTHLAQVRNSTHHVVAALYSLMSSHTPSTTPPSQNPNIQKPHPYLTAPSRHPRHHPHPNPRLPNRPLRPPSLPPNPHHRQLRSALPPGPPPFRQEPPSKHRRHREHEAGICYAANLPLPQTHHRFPARTPRFTTKEIASGKH